MFHRWILSKAYWRYSVDASMGEVKCICAILDNEHCQLFKGIVYSTDAQFVWKDLKERFDKANGSRIFSLYRDIGSLTPGNMTVSVYYTTLRQMWDEYASLFTLLMHVGGGWSELIVLARRFFE
ncbi:UBN2_3 domain-containing protein [Cephalotus follicularis]|uniref:UBN2_3 domain-containing protein n=1 Tax=Cephalotus follicularis TaxID=3775 RepID=A0A1Q3BH14_CEPFO|nr:UBN2_3 domain-containing protein [Cephalotus follicularis]